MAQTQILLKVALNTITLNPNPQVMSTYKCPLHNSLFYKSFICIGTWQSMENDNAMMLLISFFVNYQKKYLKLIFCQNLQNF